MLFCCLVLLLLQGPRLPCVGCGCVPTRLLPGQWRQRQDCTAVVYRTRTAAAHICRYVRTQVYAHKRGSLWGGAPGRIQSGAGVVHNLVVDKACAPAVITTCALRIESGACRRLSLVISALFVHRCCIHQVAV